jgi:hypothetical protein
VVISEPEYHRLRGGHTEGESIEDLYIEGSLIQRCENYIPENIGKGVQIFFDVLSSGANTVDLPAKEKPVTHHSYEGVSIGGSAVRYYERSDDQTITVMGVPNVPALVNATNTYSTPALDYISEVDSNKMPYAFLEDFLDAITVGQTFETFVGALYTTSELLLFNSRLEENLITLTYSHRVRRYGGSTVVSNYDEVVTYRVLQGKKTEYISVADIDGNPSIGNWTWTEEAVGFHTHGIGTKLNSFSSKLTLPSFSQICGYTEPYNGPSYISPLVDIRPFTTALQMSSTKSTVDAYETFHNVIEANHLETLSELGAIRELIPDGIITEFLERFSFTQWILSGKRFIDFCTNLYLWYLFGARPVLESLEEISDKMDRIAERYRKPPQSLTTYGSFDYDLPWDTFQRNAHLTARTKMRLTEAPDSYDSLFKSGLGLDLSLSGWWDTVPLSFVIDWPFGIGNRLQSIDTFNALLYHNVHWFVHSCKVSIELTDDDIDSLGISRDENSEPVYQTVYYRWVDKHMRFFNYNPYFDFESDVRIPAVTAGSLLWQVLT